MKQDERTQQTGRTKSKPRATQEHPCNTSLSCREATARAHHCPRTHQFKDAGFLDGLLCNALCEVTQDVVILTPAADVRASEHVVSTRRRFVCGMVAEKHRYMYLTTGAHTHAHTHTCRTSSQEVGRCRLALDGDAGVTACVVKWMRCKS